VSASPNLRRALAGIGVAGAVVCAVLLVLAIDSVGGHHRDLIAIFGPIIGAAFIGTGIAAWLRRPENRFGALMIAVGFSYCLSGLIVTTRSWPFIAGLLLIALPYAVLFHILSRSRQGGWSRARPGRSPPRRTSPPRSPGGAVC
jgi:peptidoglycan/LPS O-acetylase OafA/YrhL